MHVVRTMAALAAGVLLAAGCSDGQVQRSDAAGQTRYVEGTGVVTIVPPDERQEAPEFSGPLLGGTGEFDLAQAEGDVVVLNVWASWCPPCRNEAPALQAASAELADQDVQFVGINVRDNDVDAQAFEQEFGLTYPSVVDTTGSLLLAFRDTLPPTAIPSTLVVDREGRLAARILDEVTQKSLHDLVADIAAEDAATADG
jgi:thiol-disulfide isomerase/thioredoxin